MPLEVGICASYCAKYGFYIVLVKAFVAEIGGAGIFVHVNIIVCELCAVVSTGAQVSRFQVCFLSVHTKLADQLL